MDGYWGPKIPKGPHRRHRQRYYWSAAGEDGEFITTDLNRGIGAVEELRNYLETEERRLGWKWQPEIPLQRYRADFLEARSRLIIEIDGESHFNAAAIAADLKKELSFARDHYETLRFTNRRVSTSFGEVVMVIEKAYEARLRFGYSKSPVRLNVEQLFERVRDLEDCDARALCDHLHQTLTREHPHPDVQWFLRDLRKHVRAMPDLS